MTLTTSACSPGESVKPNPEESADNSGMCETAHRIRELSVQKWGEGGRVDIVGKSPSIENLLRRVQKTSQFDEPVLILGESGVGKESFAQAFFLLGRRNQRPFVSVNCPQYQEGNLTVSELFGHKRGSFTGATEDRKGCFETADGGVIFLDEIGDLPMNAQVMLLRALATGEYKPMGSNASKQADVRIVAATNRNLNRLIAKEQFRRDLLFRLRSFQIEIPPLRERGDDWRLLLDHFLDERCQAYGTLKTFSTASLKLLAGYSWPGNVRELINVVRTGYALADGEVIQPADFVDFLEECSHSQSTGIDRLYQQLIDGDGSFWKIVQQPYLDRDLNRRQVRRLITRGLEQSQGSYRRLLELWNLPGSCYQKFMDFLRHHRLKPDAPEEEALF